jgi:D-tyrosyl-tRNA(Tyr) deacylase
MIAVAQRVSEAQVSISGAVHAKINGGLLVLLGVGEQDSEAHSLWLAEKIAKLRIFGKDKMDLSLIDQGGEALVVSQFTLLADTRKGNRPSFIAAAKPDLALPLYEAFVKKMAEFVPVKTGVFGADMQVSLTNDGPVTLVLDSSHYFASS